MVGLLARAATAAMCAVAAAIIPAVATYDGHHRGVDHFTMAVAGQHDGAAAAAPITMRAHGFNLSDVRLIPDAENHFAQAQDLNTRFLEYLDADRLLFTFRTINGLPQHEGAAPYGGWIAPVGRMELVNGHFTGHFLSALAFTAASTGDSAILAKSDYLVQELGKCQDAWCKKNASECGYLSAYHISQIYALENHTGSTWATYYTLHKIMAGMLDTYQNTGEQHLRKYPGVVMHAYAAVECHGWMAPQSNPTHSCAQAITRRSRSSPKWRASSRGASTMF